MDAWAEPRRERRRKIDALLATMMSPHVNRLEMAGYAATHAAGSVVAMAVGQTLVSALLPRDKAGHAGGLVGSMGLLSLVNLLSQEVSSLVAKLLSDRPKDSEYIKKVFRAKHREIIRKYENDVRLQPAEVGNEVCVYDLFAEKYISLGDSVTAIECLRIRQEILLSLPTRTIDLCNMPQGRDAGAQDPLGGRVRGLIGEYPDEMRTTLAAFIGQVRANSQLAVPRRTQIYLEGPPGTGKTRFAHRLAETLGLPLCSVHCGGGSIRSLFDPVSQYSDKNEFLKNQANNATERIGQVPAAVVASGVLNPIVLLDEFGALLPEPGRGQTGLPVRADSDVLGAFDGERADLYIKTLKVSMDLTRCAFLLTGNTPMTDAALANRIKRVRFDRVDARVKQETIHRALDDEIRRAEPIMGGATQIAFERASWLAGRIIAIDGELKIPGVRAAIAAAREVVGLLISARLAGEDVTDEEAEGFIRDALTQRMAAAGDGKQAAKD